MTDPQLDPYAAADAAARDLSADYGELAVPDGLDERLHRPVRAALYLREQLGAQGVDAGPILADARHIAVCELLARALASTPEEVTVEVEAAALAGFIPNAAALLAEIASQRTRSSLLAGADELAALRGSRP